MHLHLRSEENLHIQEKISYANSRRNHQNLERRIRKCKDEGHLEH